MKWISLFWFPFVTGCRMAKFLKDEDMTLENHVIATITAADPIKCRWDCVDTPLCFSVNVRKLGLTGPVTCELNNSSKTADPQDFMPSVGTQYHQMAEVERCTLEKCDYKDALPDNWYRFGSKLIKLFPERRTWEQAQQFCESVGGELVSVNNEDENEFISHLLNQIKTDTAVSGAPASLHLHEKSREVYIKARSSPASLAGKDPNQTIAHWILDGSDSYISLVNGARYEEEDGVKSLYLDGSGAHATTPAVDFSQTSFTITSWVKLQSPVNDESAIYADWSDPVKFIVYAYLSGSVFFGAINNEGHYLPWFGAGSLTIDKWSHVAAVWDANLNKAHLFLDSERFGSQSLTSGSYPRNNSHSVYDIGLKRDSGISLKGHLRDLIVIGRAITGEELLNMADPFGGVWIGLNDVTSEGNFRWPDGTHVTYTNWATSLSRNQTENHDCVRMTVDKGAWDDTGCGKELPFVCEKKIYTVV